MTTCVQPPDLWEKRLPARMRERGPRSAAWCRRRSDRGCSQGRRRQRTGRRREQLSGMQPSSRPTSRGTRGATTAMCVRRRTPRRPWACHVSSTRRSPSPTRTSLRNSSTRPERVEHMDRDGVLASLCFPMSEFPRFCGQVVPRRFGQRARARLRPGLQRLHPGGVVRSGSWTVHPTHPRAAVGSPPRRGRSRADRRLAVRKRSPSPRRRTSSACRPSTTPIAIGIRCSGRPRRRACRSAPTSDPAPGSLPPPPTLRCSPASPGCTSSPQEPLKTGCSVMSSSAFLD